MGGKIVSEDEKRDVIARAKAGESNAAIGRVWGCKAETIRKRLELYGVKSAHKPGLDDAVLAEIKKLWLEGRSGQEIADQLGLTKNTVVGYVQRRGWKRTNSLAKAAADMLAKANTARAKAAPRPVRAKPQLKIVGNGAVMQQDPVQRPPVIVARVIGAAPGSLGLIMTDPRFGGCRWPIGGEGADMRFCCARRPDGRIYCDHHHDAACSRQPLTRKPGADPTKELMRSLRRFA